MLGKLLQTPIVGSRGGTAGEEIPITHTPSALPIPFPRRPRRVGSARTAFRPHRHASPGSLHFPPNTPGLDLSGGGNQAIDCRLLCNSHQRACKPLRIGLSNELNQLGSSNHCVLPFGRYQIYCLVMVRRSKGNVVRETCPTCNADQTFRPS